MPEMSADVEHPDVTVVTVGHEPTTVPTPACAATPANNPATPSNGHPKPPLAPPSTPAPDAPRWRLAAVGYALLIAGFVLALTIPHFRLRAGIREEALVILSITAMLAGAATTLASFVLNLLRQP